MKATQNEIDEESAKALVANGCKVVCEGANMPPDRCHSCAGMYHWTNLILGSCCQRFCSG